LAYVGARYAPDTHQNGDKMATEIEEESEMAAGYSNVSE